MILKASQQSTLPAFKPKDPNKDVMRPGIHGGKWYRDPKTGKVKYGTPPLGLRMPKKAKANDEERPQLAIAPYHKSSSIVRMKCNFDEIDAMSAILDVNGVERPSDVRKQAVINIVNRIGNDQSFKEAARYFDEHLDRARIRIPGYENEHRFVHNFINQWSYTSGDHDSFAISVQRRAAEEFNLDNAIQHWDPEYLRLSDEYERIGDGTRIFLRAQYDNTQQFLRKAIQPAANGNRYVTLYRGLSFPGRSEVPYDIRDVGPDAQHAKIASQPLSSWSTDLFTGHQFARMNGWPYQYVVAASFPIERVIGTQKTGYGCGTEAEMVTLGGYDHALIAEADNDDDLFNTMESFNSAIKKIRGEDSA